MPQQLIYTSAPRGIVAGRSGHCTVARSAGMRDALMLQLEKLSYYQHLSLSGGRERPICASRIVDIRGSRFHVLSRIQDAGLDFTGRTNFIAHHLVFDPQEIRQFATPPVLLRDWSGWVKAWTKEPELFEREDWQALATLATASNVPAQKWRQVTGDAVNGYGLLEARSGASFRLDDEADETVLGLFAESLELLEVRDPQRNFREAAWNYTFTTSMQEQDNPADFRWRCIHSDNPVAARFMPPDCRPLASVRAARCTAEEEAFARGGRLPPRLVEEPSDISIEEGESARLAVKAEGVPQPSYQWFCVDRADKGQPMPGETKPQVVLSNLTRGRSRFVVRVANDAGDLRSRIVVVSVEPKNEPLSIRRAPAAAPSAPGNSTQIAAQEGDDDDLDESGAEPERYISGWWLMVILIVALAGAGAWWWARHNPSPKPERGPGQTASPTNATSQNSVAPPPSSAFSNDQLAPRQLADRQLPPGTPKPPVDSAGDSPPPTTFDLPSGWTRRPIGNVSNPHAEYVPKWLRFDLSGVADGFSPKGDNVLFVSEANVTARFQATLQPLDIGSSASRCGIMMRESDKPNAPFLFIGASTDSVYIYSRDSQEKFLSTNYSIPPAAQRRQMYFQFLQQQGRVVPAFSFDGYPKNWLPGDPGISSDRQALVGLAICSGSPSNKVVAKFGAVSN